MYKAHINSERWTVQQSRREQVKNVDFMFLAKSFVVKLKGVVKSIGLSLFTYIVCVVDFSNKSIVVVADNSVISWGAHPTYGELVNISFKFLFIQLSRVFADISIRNCCIRV